MGLYTNFVKNISLNDIKNAASYKIHASYIFLSIIVTWFLSLTSTMLITIFLGTLFITIVNVAKNDSHQQDINVMLANFENESEEEEVDESNSNTLSNSVSSDEDEIVVERDQ